MRVLSKIPPPFPEQQGSLCIHSFFSFLEAPGQEENDAITTFLLHNRWMAGVNDPGDLPSTHLEDENRHILPRKLY